MHLVNITEWIPQNVYRTYIQQDLLLISVYQVEGVFEFYATWTTLERGHQVHLQYIFYTPARMTFVNSRFPDLSQILDEALWAQKIFSNINLCKGQASCPSPSTHNKVIIEVLEVGSH